jgi:colanic acid biosynthesis glycosyl transferase WcaI
MGHKSKTGKHVLLLNQWFDPEPCVKDLRFTEALIDRGFKVTVVTGTPNYPTGKIYDGYRMRWHERRTMKRTEVHVVALYPSHDNSAAKRIVNYASFFVTGFIRTLALSRRADVIYAYHPPLTVPFAAVLVGKLTRRPTVVEIQDLWPESLAATGMANRKWIISVVNAMAGWVYRNSTVLVAQSEGFRDALIARGAEPERVEVVYNCASESTDTDETPSTSITSGHTSDSFHVLYAGNLGPAQDLDTLLDASKILAKRLPTAVVHLMGTGQSESHLKERAVAEQLSNVRFHGLQPMGSINNVLRQADVLLVILKDDPLFRITVPSKTQSSLLAGRPIVIAVAGEAAEMVLRAGAGIAAEPGDAESVARAIEHVAGKSKAAQEQMGNDGRSYYEANLSFDATMEKTVAAIHSAHGHFPNGPDKMNSARPKGTPKI